ncbi:MAG: gamma-glutamyl-gamma-aminobutyrate hydrolase family protein [Deltaproteobacteria bacterium]|nr:gamma-glutamyl-gamma-aminobutyrate hydrolase family protein [Deltaproteobacteria bacterium]
MSVFEPFIGITTDIKTDVAKEESFLIETTYARAIAKAGGIPVLLPLLSANGSLLENLVAKIDGLLLPGGRDMDPKFYNEEPHPKLRLMSLERTESEMVILEEALKRDIPVLGICGGMQLINVFFKGSLYQDIPSLVPNALIHEKGSVHKIYVEEGTLLQEIIQEKSFSIKSYHHQSVKALGSGLRVCATCPDGVIEAIEGTDSFILGIQWHPEREESEISKRIFKAFMDECNK